MQRKIWTEDKLDWVIKNKQNFSSRQELLFGFNKEFNSNISFGSLISICKIRKISLRFKCHSWKEKIEWLESNKHKYSDREDILEELNKQFGTNYTLLHIKDMSTKCKLNLPLANKRIYQGLKNGRIKLMGVSERQIGEESYKSGKNIYVKTNNTSDFTKNFTLKHRYLYEQYHNVRLNHDDFVIFLNGNHNDFSKDNLYKIPRKVHDLMSGHRLHNTKLDRISAITFCEWKEKLNQLGGYNHATRTI